MANVFNARRLREAKTSDQVLIFQTALSQPEANPVSLTEALLSHVASGSLSPVTIATWLTVNHDPLSTIAALRQTHSAFARKIAIKHLKRHLRNQDTFRQTWTALGGAKGVAELMAGFSVRSVRELCDCLGKTASAEGNVKRERQEAMTSLLAMLCPSLGLATDDGYQNTDTRPLQSEYYRTVPACTAEAVAAWANNRRDQHRMFPKDPDMVRREAWTQHRHLLEDHILDEGFARQSGEKLSKKTKLNLVKLEPYIYADVSFGRRVLSMLSEVDSTSIDADEFLLFVAVPIAQGSSRRLSNHRTTWPLLLECFRKHRIFADNARYSEPQRIAELLRYACWPWKHPQATEKDKVVFAAFVSLLPEKECQKINLTDVIRAVIPKSRYAMLRAWCLHSSNNDFDIDQTPSAGSEGWQKARFTAKLFIILPPVESLRLFERLTMVNPQLRFIQELESDAPQRRLHRRYSARRRKPPTLRRRYSFDHRAGRSDKSEEAFAKEAPADPQLLYAFLLARAAATSEGLSSSSTMALEQLREVTLRERRREAERGKEPQTRSAAACAALQLAIAIGDLDLLLVTLDWARRFNKDAVTTARLYKNMDILHTPQTVDLLCVIPERGRVPIKPLPCLKDKIERANAVLVHLCHTGAAILEEEVQEIYVHQSTHALTQTVVNRRLVRLANLQSTSEMDEDAVYETVLRPTLDMLIEIESLMLKKEHHRIPLLPPEGIMYSIDPLIEASGKLGKAKLDKSKLDQEKRDALQLIDRFFDDLARRRDSLWTQTRAAEHPAVLTLDAIWPRGLPIQHLIPDGVEECFTRLPFIQSRAKSIVFCRSDSALAPVPQDKITIDAVGLFVNRWKTALRFYIGLEDDTVQDSPIERYNKAWDYAITKLSRGRFTPDEARRFWGQHFGKHREHARIYHIPGVFEVLQQRARDKSEALRLAVPGAVPSGQPIEWDPRRDEINDSEPTEDDNDRYLSSDIEKACIDCMLGGLASMDRSPLIPDIFDRGRYILPSVPQPFWTKHAPLYKSFRIGANVDAFIAVSLLSQMTAFGSGPSLLAEPFPSAQDPRFPAMYLDDVYLENEEAEDRGWSRRVLPSRSEDAAFPYLLSHIPPQLLLRLATSIFNRSREKDDVRTQCGAFVRVVKSLVRSDHPALASELISRFIIEQPQRTKYHRMLCAPSFLDRLSPEQGQLFVEHLTDSILAKLKDQDDANHEWSASMNSVPDEAVLLRNLEEPKKMFVKTTTVRMLAQILQHTSSVPVTTCQAILTRVASCARHVDIRVAALAGLTGLARGSDSETLRDEILNLFYDIAVPIAGRLDESRDETPEFMEAAARGGPLPDVITGRRERPMTTLLIHAKLPNDDTESKGLSPNLQLLMSALRVSAKRHQQWMELFMQRNGADLVDLELPLIPVCHHALSYVLKNVHLVIIPLDLFQEMQRYVMLILQPHPEIVKITNTVKTDAELSASKAGKHWLNIWDHQGWDGVCNLGARWATQSLEEFAHGETLGQMGLVQSRQIWHFISDMAEVFIKQADVASFEKMVESISCFPKEADATSRSFGVLHTLIHNVEVMRTPEWLASKSRVPACLPSTLFIRLKLLMRILRAKYNSETGQRVEDILEFVNQLTNLLRRIVEMGLSSSYGYHSELEEVKAYLNRHTSGKQRMKIIPALGLPDCLRTQDKEITEEEKGESAGSVAKLTLVDMLRVEIAASMIHERSSVWEDQEVRETVRKWEDSDVERVRDIGRVTREKAEETVRTEEEKKKEVEKKRKVKKAKSVYDRF